MPDARILKLMGSLNFENSNILVKKGINQIYKNLCIGYVYFFFYFIFDVPIASVSRSTLKSLKKKINKILYKSIFGERKVNGIYSKQIPHEGMNGLVNSFYLVSAAPYQSVPVNIFGAPVCHFPPQPMKYLLQSNRSLRFDPGGNFIHFTRFT